MSLGRVAGVGCHGFGLRNPLRLAPEHETKIIRGTPFRIPSTVPSELLTRLYSLASWR